MLLPFHKYQSTGNDFILIDNRKDTFPKSNQQDIQRICHRKFGIGADGLILLELSAAAEFKMVYFNADGGIGSFCGNGSRAAVHFAQSLGMRSGQNIFEAYDGLHQAVVKGNFVQIKMSDVGPSREILNGSFIDTGSPHYVAFIEDLDKFDVVKNGRTLRHDTNFAPNGANINFVEKKGPAKINIRTYERGVENETLSCGTGATAAAIVASQFGLGNEISINTKGGPLKVWFEQDQGIYKNVWLEGPTELVFAGDLEI